MRLLVSLKPIILGALAKLSAPFAGIGRFFLFILILPAYRLFIALRRPVLRLYRPAKNKTMFFVTNRYVIHVVVSAIVALTIFLNFHTNDVRAETFGEQSLMYKLVTQQDATLIEEVAGDWSEIERFAVSYREDIALSSFTRGVDFLSPQDVQLPIIGGSSIVATPTAGGAASVAPRERIETYVVQSGDTISTIAARFGISVNTLLWANNLSVTSTLRPGQELTILPVTGLVHTVKSGDTISRIANTYGAEADKILAYNKMQNASEIKVGETLIIPDGERQAPAPIARTTTVTTPRIPTTTSSAAPSVGGSGAMIWPTDLRVITQYYGWSHTGIDIDCHFTHQNYAADDGIVQYSGWKGGYGYTVEINHGNGIVTRYGHHASLAVSAGQQVSKGTALGVCGTTGRSTGTHLHFEVIVNGRYRNPLEYIR